MWWVVQPVAEKKNGWSIFPISFYINAIFVKVYFSAHPAAIFTPRRCGFIPVFTLSRNGSDSNSGIDGFDAGLYNWFYHKVVRSSVSCSVFGTQHPGEFLLCVRTPDTITQNTLEDLNEGNCYCNSDVGRPFAGHYNVKIFNYSVIRVIFTVGSTVCDNYVDLAEKVIKKSNVD